MNKKLENYITVKEVNSISDELRFQREYYNFKCEDKKDELKISYSLKENNGKVLGDEIALLIEDITGNEIERDKKTNIPKNLSESVFKNIEKPKISNNKYKRLDNKEVRGLNTYYLIMYYMFKLYGFLEDYDIFELLNKYGIEPKTDEMKEQAEILKTKCNEKYKNKRPFDLGYYNIVFRREDVIDFCREYEETKYKLLGQDNIERYRKCYNNSLKLSKIRNIIIDEYIKLNDIERKTKSLDIGKPTNFIDELLKGDANIMTNDTMMKILEDLKLTNTDLYYLLDKEVRRVKNEKLIKKNENGRIRYFRKI